MLGLERSSLSFNIDSDFVESDKIPLKLEFFEGVFWEYTEASSDYSRDENWGCWGNSETEQDDVPSMRFCSVMNISETNSLMAGAEIIINGGSGTLDIVIYDNSEGEIGSCNSVFNPSVDEDFCIIEFSDGLAEGIYYVCLEDVSATSYKISRERGNSNNSCGWSQSGDFSVPSSFSKDFPIFIKLPSYSSATGLGQYFQDEVVNPGESFWDDVLEDLNDFVVNKYSRNCSDGCVFPVAVSGVSQKFKVSSVNLGYTVGTSDDHSLETATKVYGVDDTPATVSFKGILDLVKLEFGVGGPGKRIVNLKLDGDSFGLTKFDDDIEVVNAPIISYVIPTNLPAGILTTFTVGLNFSSTNLTYVWVFGDGDVETTSVNYIQHSYKEIKAYTMTVNVTGNGFTSSKDFTIVAGSPKEAVNGTLDEKEGYLNSSKSDIAGFPVWLRPDLEKMANITYYESELSRLRTAAGNAFSDADYLKVVIDLQELDIPKSVFVSESLTSPLITDLGDVDVGPVVAIGGGNPADSSKYANSVLRWQEDYVDVLIKSEKISVSRARSGRNVLLTVFDISIGSDYDQESYFVMKKDYGDLYFNKGDGRKSEDSTVVILDKLSTKDLQFYFKGEDEFPMFASPKISQLTISVGLDVCNRNGKCEEGEDTDNCPDDCKPYGRAILYIILVIVGAVILYTILQVWYKTRYEGHLFKDRRHLFNLLMFIDNARAQGMDDDAIRAKLKDKNWSGEQLTYALKKSRGERTGMFEIMPVEPLLAWNRRRKAEKRVQAQTASPKGMVGVGFRLGGVGEGVGGLKR